MAELTHFYDSEDAIGRRTGVGYANTVDSGANPAQIAGATLAATTKYLIIARAMVGGDNAGATFGVRISSQDDFGALSTKSEMIFEPMQTADGGMLPYLFVHSFTTDSSPGTLEFQVNQISGGDEVRIQGSSILCIDLDAIGTEGTDYFEDIQADSGDEYSTNDTTTVLAQISSGDLTTDQEYLILGYARADIGSTGRWFKHEYVGAFDSGTPLVLQAHQAEGEDTTEQRLSGVAARYLRTSGSVNCEIFGSEEAANGNMLDGGAYLIALPTSLFADFVVDYESGAIEIADPSDITIATVGAYTPSVSGNHLIIGRANGQDTPALVFGMYVEDGTTEIRTGDSTPSHNQIWDVGKDNEFMATFQRLSISSEVTLNLKSILTFGTVDVEHRWLIVVNLNKSSLGPSEKYRQTRVVQGLVSADRRSA